MADTDRIIPADVHLAAKRGFVRTTFQAYAATLTTSVSASTIVSIIQGEVDWTVVIVTLALALVSPLAAGLVSYLNISSQGIPGEYQPEVVEVVEGTGRHRAEPESPAAGLETDPPSGPYGHPPIGAD